MRVVLLLAVAACGRIAFEPLGLAIDPPAIRTNLSTRTQFVASGGIEPYTFSIVLGAGEVNASTGAYRSAMYPGSAVVQVIDQRGQTATADVSFGGAFLYFAGGLDTTALRADVYRSSDGINWQAIGQLPEARMAGMMFVLDDEMFYAGGSDFDVNGAARAEIWGSRDGVTWRQAGTLPIPLFAADAIVFRDQVWIAGGLATSNAFSARVVTSSDLVNWVDQAPLPQGLHNAEAVSYRGGLWLNGGHAAVGNTTECRVTTDGTQWALAGQLPAAPADYHSATVFADRIWVAGGSLVTRVISTTDGAAWVDAAMMPTSRIAGQLFELGGELWIMGGREPSIFSTVDGTSWQTRGTFPPLEGGLLVQFTPQ